MAAEKEKQQPENEQMLGSTGNTPHWQPLYYFNLYRLLLAILILALPVIYPAFGDLFMREPGWFPPTALAMSLTALVNLYTVGKRWPSFGVQAHYQIIIDIALITVLIHSSNGVDSGFVALLLVSVAVAATLFDVRITLFYAALASAVILGAQLFTHLFETGDAEGYSKAGFLGVGLFATGLLVSVLFHRAQRIQKLLKRQEVDLANLDEINRRVVERLNTGVIVIDRDDVVRSSNARAQQLLKIGRDGAGTPLQKISRELGEMIQDWRKHPGVALPEIKLMRSNINVAPVVTQIGDGHMIFLEDVSTLESRTREGKLVAIGRLAASIAHEIRNPLGAISHAGQLLAEIPQLESADKRLVGIVQEQSQRINKVVETVLQFTQQSKTKPEMLKLLDWLEEFRHEFTQGEKIPVNAVELDGSELVVEFDPAHLKQVLTNLCHNAVRHSPPYSGLTLVTIRLFGTLSTDHWLDVIDYGSGIPKENRDKLFEPFFTTHSRGTGLGLFISRELCSSNGASLEYVSSKAGSCFRIKFGVD